MPTIRQQNVAEHSFHVAWIAAWLSTFSQSGLIQLDRLLWAALVHDDSESITGDTSAPFKKIVKEAYSEFERQHSLGVYGVEGLTDQERCILKIADLLEALLFLKEERQMGNNMIADVWDDVYAKIEPVWDRFRWAVTDEDPVKPNAAMLVERFWNMVPITRHPGMWDIK